MESFRAFECVCEKQFSNDNAPPRPSLHRPRLCRGSTSLFGILRHPIYPCLDIALYCAIFQALYTPDLPPPARISSSNSNVGWNMMYAPLLQI